MRTLVVMVMSVLALALAAPASADPDDHVPYCSGDQTPMDYSCRLSPSHDLMPGSPGANPDLPIGLTPDVEPAI